MDTSCVAGSTKRSAFAPSFRLAVHEALLAAQGFTWTSAAHSDSALCAATSARTRRHHAEGWLPEQVYVVLEHETYLGADELGCLGIQLSDNTIASIVTRVQHWAFDAYCLLTDGLDRCA